MDHKPRDKAQIISLKIHRLNLVLRPAHFVKYQKVVKVSFSYIGMSCSYRTLSPAKPIRVIQSDPNTSGAYQQYQTEEQNH